MDIKTIKDSIVADNYDISQHALIYGKDEKGKPLHVVCAFSPIIKLITVYYPDENKWIEYKRRK